MGGSIICGVDGTASAESAAEVSRRASCPVVVVPPGAGGWTANSGRDDDFAGGIVRLGSADGDTEFAGGILRFNLGGRGN